jgi:hypothetical protein
MPQNAHEEAATHQENAAQFNRTAARSQAWDRCRPEKRVLRPRLIPEFVTVGRNAVLANVRIDSPGRLLLLIEYQRHQNLYGSQHSKISPLNYSGRSSRTSSEVAPCHFTLTAMRG